MKKSLFIASLMLSGAAHAQTVTRLDCDISGTVFYRTGDQERYRNQVQINVSTLPNGTAFFDGEGNDFALAMSTQSRDPEVKVLNYSTAQVWDISMASPFKGFQVMRHLKIDRVTGRITYSRDMGNGTREDANGTCSKITQTKNKF